MPISIVIPTFNEAGNVAELVGRLNAVGIGSEILFVDDSTDDTPAAITAAARTSDIPLRLLQRETPVGGLSGAVLMGMTEATNDWVLVMDADLQHPPEMIPVLAETAGRGAADVVVASRYCEDGDAGGLSNAARRAVSSLSTVLTRSMFPSKLRDCTDPMTGFFLVRKSALVIEDLQPRGFKILLEILARQPRRLTVLEEPFVFGERFAGQSKASLSQGVRFMSQLLSLRFGRMSAFAVIGLIGALCNIAIVALITWAGFDYLAAAIIAAEVTIVGNFLLLERFVFRDLTRSRPGTWSRFWKSFAFNNAETALRLPLLFLLVDLWTIAAVPATGITLIIAFLARFVFHSRVIYGPPASSAGTPSIRAIEESDSDRAVDAP
ncbi:glycosyltransferase [Planctomonas psychrotolerans]|uniref:glycosyltransferase n=1 Tax=Planctomonas psychrotolerans TaxID=2528712 RepID=UPI00123C564C|nr:glycosyltransferase family 2 protein [Planctomonas psychrotolerans]